MSIYKFVYISPSSLLWTLNLKTIYSLVVIQPTARFKYEKSKLNKRMDRCDYLTILPRLYKVGNLEFIKHEDDALLWNTEFPFQLFSGLENQLRKQMVEGAKSPQSIFTFRFKSLFWRKQGFLRLLSWSFYSIQNGVLSRDKRDLFIRVHSDLKVSTVILCLKVWLLNCKQKQTSITNVTSLRFINKI